MNFKSKEGASGASAVPEDATSETSPASQYHSANPSKWGKHPINVRITLPIFGSRFYFTMVAGRERRSDARLTQDREDHPVITLGNVFFALGITTMIAMAVLVVQSAMIE